MARLKIAMLSQTAGVVEEPIQSVKPIELYDQETENSINETNALHSEIEVVQQAMSDTEEVVQEMKEERAALEAAMLRGGADSFAMEALQRAVKRFEKRTGVDCKVRSIGLEGFQDRTTRMQSTKVAMEAALDYMKKLATMLTAAASSVLDKVNDFLGKLLVGAEKTAKRARDLDTALSAIEGKQAGADAKITTPSVLKYARLNDSVHDGSAFANDYAKHAASSESYRNADADFVKNWINSSNYDKIIQEAKTPDNEEAILKLITGATQDIPGAVLVDGLQTSKSKDVYLGDFAAVETSISTKSSWEELSKNYNKVKYSLQKSDNDYTVKEVKPLSVDDAKKIINGAIELMDAFKQIYQQQKQIDSEMKRILSESKSLLNDKNSPVDQLRVATGFVRSHSNAVMRKIADHRSYDINLTKAALDYVAASIKAIEGSA